MRVAVLAAVLTLSCHGDRWRVLTTEGNADAVAILSLVFADAGHGWAVTSTHVFESKDGGKVWVSRLSEASASFQVIVFRDGERGWIFGSRGDASSHKGVVWRTTNGGDTWTESATNVPGPLSAASFCSPSLGFAVDAEQVLRTTNGGVTWVVSFQGNPNDQFSSVGCSGPSEAWVVGSKATALRTGDGGESWQRRELGKGKDNLTRVYFSANRGWILGLVGVVFVSEDRGETWKRLPVPTTDALFDIRVNDVEGWIVGTRGTILRSGDGGLTWKSHESPTDKDLVALAVLAPDDVWAGGSQMTVLRLSR